MAWTLENEHTRYARHDAASATHFFASRDLSIDSWGRKDPQQIVSRFHNLDAYEEAVDAVAQKWAAPSRYCAADFINYFDPAHQKGPPERHTLNRCLSNSLYLIVMYEDGKWGHSLRAEAPP